MVPPVSAAKKPGFASVGRRYKEDTKQSAISSALWDLVFDGKRIFFATGGCHEEGMSFSALRADDSGLSRFGPGRL